MDPFFISSIVRTMPYVKVLFAILVAVLPFSQAAVKLNNYIQHYETLNYDSSVIHHHHLRAKRSLSNPFVHINFHAYGRHFPIRLKRDTSVFSENLIVDVGSKKLDDFDLSHIYSGSLWGEKDTIAFGSIRDGVFDGMIKTPSGNYYVERAKNYFSPAETDAANFHSVIYSENDVLRHEHAGHGSGCGITEDVQRWMDNIQQSAVQEQNTKNTSESDDAPKDAYLNKILKEDYNKYSREAQQWADFDSDVKQRSKRGIPEKRACSLYIQTDPLLWEHIHVKESDATKTREEIASLIAQHVKAVNLIYESEDFGGFRGIKFLVQRITINDTSSCDLPHDDPGRNPFCVRNIDVSNFLNLNSQMNHNAFCLAYVFTYRDFTGGTLGLAWVASPQGASGGICEEYKAYTENSGGRHIQTKRSLNTGIITFVNYNSRVPPKVSQLTLAHEIGHNFGSPHDWPPDCRPGGLEGNFIMFASATSGDRPHNSKFSECSKRNITKVLKTIFDGKGGKKNCFLEDGGSFCGNHIVEAGEQCDCGYNDEECTETCCYPRELTEQHKRENGTACTRRLAAQCSPSEGPCCNLSCQFERNKVCRSVSDCNEEAKCNGYSPQCPASVPKQNGTECNKNTQVCVNGECIGSICLKHKLEECFLTKAKGVTPEQLCEVACQNPGQPDTCMSSFDQQSHFGMDGIRLRPGAPCDNFQGYCDVFQKCRAVDAEGPLARLKNLLLDQRTLTNIAQWVTEFWWAVLLMGIALIIVMAVFIKCCAVHTPSSNPKKQPALRFSETLRHPTETLRRKRHRHHQTAPQAGQAPPPYPGRSRGGPSRGGPSRGYGEGRGHYNNRAKTGWLPSEPYAAAYPPGYFEMTPRQHNV